MPGQAFDALYYPYMHFWDVGWLKSTALYWDSISRIVPAGFDPKDSDDVKYLIDKGYIDDARRYPDTYDIQSVAESMRRFVIAHGDELRARYSRMPWPTPGWRTSEPDRPLLGAPAGGRQPSAPHDDHG